MIVVNTANSGTVIYPRKDVTSVNVRKGYSVNEPVLFSATSPTKIGTLTGRMWSEPGKWSWHEVATVKGLGWANGEYLTVTAPVPGPVAVPSEPEPEPENEQEEAHADPKKQGNLFIVAGFAALTLFILKD